MSLYKWNTDYSTTVGQAPIKQQTFTDLIDNARNDLVLDAPQPAGSYLVVTDQVVPSSTGKVGHYGWTYNACNTGADVPASYVQGVKTMDYPEQFPNLMFDTYYAFAVTEPTGADFQSRSVGYTDVADWALY
jgi:hypothetical protein